MDKEWVIGDIHGCIETLKGLIEDQIRPGKNDRLFFLGDYIDRGPGSKAVIDYIMALQADGFPIRLLKGNHEDYLVKAFDVEQSKKSFLGMGRKDKKTKEWLFHGGKACIQSFGVKSVKDIPAKYIQWLRDLEYYIELDNFFLVHAGFNFEKEDPFEDQDSMLWVRDYNIKPEKVKFKKVIHGHMPVSLELIDMSVNNYKKYDFIDLDNGVYMTRRQGFGNLIGLELKSMEYKIQFNLDA